MLKQWTDHLAMTELRYHTKFHTATQMAPLEFLYGYVPTIPNLAHNEETLIEAVNYTANKRTDWKKATRKSL